MKQYIYIIVASLALAMATISCSEEEGDLTLNYHDPNSFFEPAPDATDEISQLRRDFQQKYGCFLIFNDTIQKKYLGKDFSGEDVYWSEVLSLDYSIGQTSYPTEGFRYDYLKTDEDKKASLEYLENNILVHIGKELMPYSWFLCSQINEGGSAHPYCSTGQRAIVVATGIIGRLKNDKQKKDYYSRIMTAFMPKLCYDRESSFNKMFKVSGSNYGKVINIDNADEARDKARSLGYLDFYTNTWSQKLTPTHQVEFNQLCMYMYNYDEEYIQTTFADYPLVLQKWELFKECLTEIGYKF